VTSSAEARPTLLDPEAREGAELAVEGDAYRHLFRARRLAAGDAVRVVDGAGGAWSARVGSVGPKRALVRVGDAEPSLEGPLRLEHLVGLPRPQRAAWLVEKATELGVAAVRFLHTERTVRDAGRGTVERWRRVAAAALEQCGRARLPEVTGPHDWREIADLLAPCRRRYVLDPGAPPLERPTAPPDTPVAALVGPEGGWTAPERAALTDLACLPAGLGPRTLRTETAALAAAALLLVAPGDR
jgi:16S rRNA (uracil1498-N3)-methyltransferase